MVLSNYWLIVIWIIAAGVVCRWFGQVEEYVIGEKVYRYHWLPAFLMMAPYVVWAGFRQSNWGDTKAYFEMFEEAPSTFVNIRQYLMAQTKDKGFFLILTVFKSFIIDNRTAFFFTIALIQGIALVYIFRKYSNDYWFSIFLFVISCDYMSWMHNGVRQFLVVTLLFACTPLLIQKKYIKMMIIILLLSTIHQTALLWIPIVFIVQGKALNWKTVFFLLVIAMIILFLDRFTDLLAILMENSQYERETEDLLNDTGTNLLRVLFYSIPAITTIFFLRRIHMQGNALINICANMSIATAGFYIISYFTSGTYIGRIPIFFSLYNYLLYPWMIDEFFTEQSAKIIKGLLCVVYFIFFYYQMHVTWALL